MKKIMGTTIFSTVILGLVYMIAGHYMGQNFQISLIGASIVSELIFISFKLK